MPKISIIIPTFNRAEYLDAAISSVLQQTYQDFELIVTDNCSTDSTPTVIEKYRKDPRFHYFRNNENIGMVRNWRRALVEYIQADWFIILSDDDYLIDNNYIEQISQKIADTDLSLIYASGYVLDVEFNKMHQLNIPFSGKVNGTNVFSSRGTVKPQDFTLCNVVFRRDLAIKFNAFCDDKNYCCDTELFLLSCLSGSVFVINTPVSIYRVHSGNLIRRIQGNPELALGDLRSYINAYIYAKERLSSEVLFIYFENSNLLGMAENVMLCFLRHNPQNYPEIMVELNKSIPSVVGLVLNKKSFKINRWVISNLRVIDCLISTVKWQWLGIKSKIKKILYFLSSIGGA